MAIPPIIRILDRAGKPVDAFTRPPVGQAIPAESSPVTLALGMDVKQSFVPVPAFDASNNDTYKQTTVLVVAANPLRRYLKIVNNGPNKVELWNGAKPAPGDVNNSILKGEVLYDSGDGLAETDTCRTNAIYATSAGVASGLLVLEG